MEWTEKAANLGDMNACNMLGLFYYEGWGVPVDKEKGMQLLHKSAESGIAVAGRNLGYRYKAGGDLEAAAKWFRHGAELGDDVAQFELGFLMIDGQGVAMDKEQAVEWYRKSAE